jgi:hypothetical protein
MLTALVIKELRETAGLVALAVIGAIYMFGELTATPVVPWQSGTLYTYPFIGDRLGFYFCIVAGGLAVALGLRQTAWELGQGTYFFLLHRPLPRTRVFGLKLLVGGGLVLTFAALLILVYAFWAAAPGHIPAPFDWRMTQSAWTLWLTIPLIYIGAFLSGIRPAHWFGTRLAPLLAAIGLAVALTFVPWFWLAAAISILGSVLGLVSVFYYAQARDY